MVLKTSFLQLVINVLITSKMHLIPRLACVLSILTAISIKIKDVYVDVDKNKDNGDLCAFQNPCDYKICFSDYIR